MFSTNNLLFFTDSSDDDASHKRSTKKPFISTLSKIQSYNDSDNEGTSEYKDVSIPCNFFNNMIEMESLHTRILPMLIL